MLTIHRRAAFSLIVATLFSLTILPSPSTADDKKVVTTTVTVGEMCGGCVKRITAHFDKVKDVAKIRCDIKTKTVILYPAKNVRLNPKKTWEMLESIGKTPKKLVGPDGTFTAKPK